MLEQATLVFAQKDLANGLVSCLSLLQPVKTHKYASNSVILSLAAHLTHKFPHLNISNFPQKLPTFKPQTQQVNPHLSIHPLQEFWSDKLSEEIIMNRAIRKQNTLFILMELTKIQFNQVSKYKDHLREFSVKYQDNWPDHILMQLSGFEQLPRKNTHIAYLNVSGSQLRTDPYSPIINVRALILGQIFNNQKWKTYNILKDQVPTLQEFLALDSVFIPGSTNSVLSNIPSIELMSKNLFNAFEQNKKLKIFGICYGHQLIAHKNNGQVVKKRRTDKLEKIKFNETLLNQLKGKFSFLSGISAKENDNILLQHHQDYVETVSDDFYVLASSQTSQVQCLMHKSGRMLSFQSHPQYFYQYTNGFMQRIMSYNYGQSPLIEVQKSINEQRKTHHTASQRMRQVLSEFLNWNGQN